MMEISVTPDLKSALDRLAALRGYRPVEEVLRHPTRQYGHHCARVICLRCWWLDRD